MNRFLDSIKLVEESGVSGIDLSRNQNHISRKPEFFRSIVSDEKKYCGVSEFKNILSDIHHVEPSQITIGNGATDLLNVCARASLCKGKVAHFVLPSYAPIKTIIEKTGATSSEHHGDVRFIVNPNNPTGEFYIPSSGDSDYDLMVVDEAYIDYHPDKQSFVDSIDSVDNLVVIKTFSKFYGLAGLRIGYSISSKPVSEYLNKIQNQYPVSSISINAAIYALNDKDHSAETLRSTNQNLEILSNGLKKLGVYRMESCGNFITAKIPDVKGFQTRDLKFYSGLEGWRRISCSSKINIENFLIQLEKEL